MTNLKKQVLRGTLFSYVGFFIGGVNVLIFYPNLLSKEEFGLIQTMLAIVLPLVALGELGATSIVNKFFPIYRKHSDIKNNELPSILLLSGFLGVSILMILAYFNLDFIGRKFGKSPLFVEYLFLLPLMVYGSMTFNLLSIFLAHYRKSDWVMMIRDIGFRFFNFVLLGLVFLKFISFNTFVKLYSVSFALAAIAVLILLRKNKLITFTLSITKLSRRLSPKILKYGFFMWLANVCLVTAPLMDTIGVAGILGIEQTAIFAIASYFVVFVSLPQKAILMPIIPIISECWRDKKMEKLDQLYKSSSEVMLLLGGLIFANIWINIDHIYAFLPRGYEAGKWVFFVLGLAKLLDLVTSINGYILNTSTKYWKIDLMTTVGLVFIIGPLNYFFIKEFGIIGSAYANLLAYFSFNLFRTAYLRYKTKLYPLSKKTLYAFLLIGFMILTGFAKVELHLNINAYVLAGLNIFLKSAVLTLIFLFVIVRYNLSIELRNMIAKYTAMIGIKL